MKRIRCLSIILVLLSSCISLHTDSEHDAEERHVEPEIAAYEIEESITQEIAPSLIVEYEGSSVLIIDMDDPVVRAFYSSPVQFDVSGLDIWIWDYDNNVDIEGFIDPRYTFPLYCFINNTDGTEGFLEEMESYIAGAYFLDYVEDEPYCWGGIVFDEDGFPISVAEFGFDDGNLRLFSTAYPVVSEMRRYQNPVDGLQKYFNVFSSAFVMNEEIQAELTRRGFDLERTRALSGPFCSNRSYIFTDGVHEVMMIKGDNGSKNGPWYPNKFLTGTEYGSINIEWHINETTPRQIQDDYLDSLSVDGEPSVGVSLVRTINLSDGNMVKEISGLEDMRLIVDRLQSYDTMINNAKMGGIDGSQLIVILNGYEHYLIAKKGDAYYCQRQFYGACTVDDWWAEGLLELYALMDYPELKSYEEYMLENPVNPPG